MHIYILVHADHATGNFVVCTLAHRLYMLPIPFDSVKYDVGVLHYLCMRISAARGDN